VVKNERVNQSQPGNYRASFHLGGVRGRPSFDKKHHSLFMTVVADTVASNKSYEGLLLTVLLMMMKKYLLLKKHTPFKT